VGAVADEESGGGSVSVSRWRPTNKIEPPRNRLIDVRLQDGALVRVQWNPNALQSHWIDSEGNRYRAAGSWWLDD
jgi:hypothetical protein